MKRLFLLAGGVAALAVAYFGSHLLAQNPGAPAGGGTRMGVVNIGSIFTEYKKATFLKQEMEGLLQPFRGEANKLKEQIIGWQNELKKPDSKYPREDLENGILVNKRKLEDLEKQARKLIGTKQEEQMVQLWKEVNNVVSLTAKAHGFQLVFAYGDPPDADGKSAFSFPNVNRKMQALDMGASAPMYVDGSIDLTRAVIESLNASYNAAGGRPVQATPTSGGAPPRPTPNGN